YPATRTRARAAQETPYDRNEDDIEKKKDDVELIQQLTNQRKDNKIC
ncbi:12682_t:CDS:1, partial [Funneliformis geosporum]